MDDPRPVGQIDAAAEVDAVHPSRGLPRLAERALSLAVVPGDTEDTVRTKRLVTGAAWA